MDLLTKYFCIFIVLVKDTQPIHFSLQLGFNPLDVTKNVLLPCFQRARSMSLALTAENCW